MCLQYHLKRKSSRLNCSHPSPSPKTTRSSDNRWMRRDRNVLGTRQQARPMTRLWMDSWIYVLFLFPMCFPHIESLNHQTWTHLGRGFPFLGQARKTSCWQTQGFGVDWVGSETWTWAGLRFKSMNRPAADGPRVSLKGIQSKDSDSVNGEGLGTLIETQAESS
jgi:hypothetical protein